MTLLRRARNRLDVKLIALFLVLSLVPLSFVGLLSYRNSRQTIETQQFDHLNAINLLKADELNRWVRDNEQQLAALAQRPLVRQYTTALVEENPEALGERSTYDALLSNHLRPARREEGGFRELFLLRGRDGLILASTNRAAEGKYREDEPYFVQGQGGTYVQDVYFSLVRGEPLMTIGTPVRSDAGETVAVLAGHVDLDELANIMEQTNDLTATEDTYLVNAFNFFVTNPRFGRNFTLQEAIHTEGVAQCLQRESGYEIYDDYRGEPVLGAYRWLPQRQLCILTEVDRAEAFGPVYGLRDFTLGVGVLGTLGVLIAGVFFARSITSPLRQLVQGTERIGRGDLNYRLEVRAHDEIGQLAEAFNRMTANLRHSLGETAHGRRLLLALSHAAQEVQQARTPQEVYQTVGTEVAELGFNATVVLLTEDQKHLHLGYMGYGAATVRTAEKLTGVSVETYHFPLPVGGYYDRVIKEKETLFLEPMSDFIAEGLPQGVQVLAGRVATLLGMEQGIVAPLSVEGETMGVLTVTGDGLSEDDVPAVNAFANQTAIALKNAHLYEEIRQNEARFRAVFEGSAAAIFVVDLLPEGEFRYAALNPAHERLTGMKSDEVRGKSPHELTPTIPVEAAAEIEENYARCVEAGASISYEEMIPIKGGETWWLTRLSPQRDVAGNIIRLIGTSLSITERKEAERELARYQERLEELVEERTAELQQSEARFRALFEAAPMPVVVSRLEDGLILEANQHVAEVLGLPPDAVVGANASGIYRSPEARGDLIRNLQENGSVRNHELPIRRPDGSTAWLLLSATAIEYEGEGALLSGFMDVTEQKEMETKLARSNRELEQFAYVASHDLQEPLRMVTSFLQLLQRRYQEQLDETANEYIYYAVDGAARMKRLINDLLKYSRVTTKGKPPAPISSRGVFDEVLDDLRVTIEENEALITSDVLPMIMGDETQVHQLLQNLLGNAIKFRGEAPPQIHVSAERRNGSWQFTVSDNGIGIEPKQTDRIFVIFQRLHRSDEYGGTGIGLAICKKIVERHGGKIWVKSEPGQGATFYFTLPADMLKIHHYTELTDDEIAECGRTIVEYGQIMDNVIEELLLLTRLRRKEVEAEVVDMAECFDEAQQRLSYLIESRHAEIVSPTTWPAALGYGPWLEEVWTNYLSNAIKYGGQPPQIEVGAAPQENGTVWFWIRDNGPGIPLEAQDRLFVPFTQLDQARISGHGLGLSIVRRIVEKLGGQVGVESASGEGSTFTFTLPAP